MKRKVDMSPLSHALHIFLRLSHLLSYCLLDILRHRALSGDPDALWYNLAHRIGTEREPSLVFT